MSNEEQSSHQQDGRVRNGVPNLDTAFLLLLARFSFEVACDIESTANILGQRHECRAVMQRLMVKSASEVEANSFLYLRTQTFFYTKPALFCGGLRLYFLQFRRVEIS